MSTYKVLVLVFSSLILTLLPSCNGGDEPITPPDGCVKDNDCKGNRICSKGQCVDPGSGGSAGSNVGGTAGKAGNSGTGGVAGGSGGASGTGGSAGNSGTGGAGTGGTAGVAGTAGTGGTEPDAGGTGGTDVDAGGTGGSDPDAGDEDSAVVSDGGDAETGAGKGGSAGTGGTSGTGGTGGNPACTPNGASEACYDGPANTRNVGACKDGNRTCANGVWGACADEVLPSAEACDFADNDCDGAIDNGTLQVGTAVNLNVSAGADKPAAALDKAGEIGIIWTKSGNQIWFTQRNQEGSIVPPFNSHESKVASIDSSAGVWAKDALSLHLHGFTSFWSAWSENSWGSQKINVAPVNNSGSVSPTPDPSSTGVSGNASIAAKPGQAEYGLAFEKDSTPNVYFSRYSGTRLGGVQISNTPEPSITPKVAWNGTDWVVVWFEGGATNAWRYAIVADNGSAVLSSGALGIAGTSANIVAAGNAIGAAYVTGSEVRLARFTADMASLIGDTAVATGATVNGAANPVWNGTLYGVAFSTGAPGDIRVAQVSASGAVGATVNVSASAGDSRSPALVWNGTDWLTVWVEGTGGQLFLAKITRVCQ